MKLSEFKQYNPTLLLDEWSENLEQNKIVTQMLTATFDHSKYITSPVITYRFWLTW
jgi:hypothetical protein